MEIIVIVWIVIIVLNVLKVKKRGEQSGTGSFGGNSARTGQKPFGAGAKGFAGNAGRSSGRGVQHSAEKKAKESWRNTADVTRSDISFRGLREGEDELAYLIDRNTAYERILERRLVSRDH